MKSKYIIILAGILGFTLFIQAKITQDRTSMLAGMWKLEIMRDSAGIPFDIIATTGGHTPEIFQYITIKGKNRGMLREGQQKYPMNWHLTGDSIYFKLKKNHEVRSYRVISLTQTELSLMYVSGDLKGFLYYQRE